MPSSVPLMVLALFATAIPQFKVTTVPNSQICVRLPVGIIVTREVTNWETERVLLRTEKSVLIEMFIGGGAYDLHGFRRFCLNGKRAWDSGPPRRRSHRTVIVGSPGVNALSATYSNLSESDAALADQIISSILYGEGGEPCH